MQAGNGQKPVRVGQAVLLLAMPGLPVGNERIEVGRAVLDGHLFSPDLFQLGHLTPWWWRLAGRGRPNKPHRLPRRLSDSMANGGFREAPPMCHVAARPAFFRSKVIPERLST
jgi:hypothetical protein